MGFCPFFLYRECPENTDCEHWNRYGCEHVEKAGKPALYIDGEEPLDVLILHWHVKANDNIVVVYALKSDGSIHLEGDITKFKMHIL